MNLQNLPVLHENMRNQGLTKTKFDFQFRDLRFSVIYIAEEFPHELLFGCRAHNLFFVVQVRDGYAISTRLGDHYGALVKALGLRYDPLNPFSPSVFFEAFDNATPLRTAPANTPTVTDIAIHSRDVENADKVYFIGWRNHDGCNSKPSDENLAKTKRICGNDVYRTCRRHHVIDPA